MIDLTNRISESLLYLDSECNFDVNYSKRCLRVIRRIVDQVDRVVCILFIFNTYMVFWIGALHVIALRLLGGNL